MYQPDSFDNTHNANQPKPPVVPDHHLLRCIGQGSYGAVWLGRNMMGVYRAVKIVYRKSFSDQKPFERELSGIRKFEPISRSHEGFVDVLHVGINDAEGYFFYVMELGDDQIAGQSIDPDKYSPKTLEKEISFHKKLAFRECLDLGMALSKALAELHKNGLVHRDVKPSNIIFVNGVPKLADIGLVAEFDAARSYVGTTGFIPPEGPGKPQADIYSLGKVLYEASTGKDRQQFPELPTLVEDLPDRGTFLELNEVILRACQNDVELRYRSAWDMHAELLVLATGKSVKRLRLLERRLSNVKRLAAMFVIGLLVLAGVYYKTRRESESVKAARRLQDVANGNAAIESGNLLGGLPAFADALSVDKKNSSGEKIDRIRLASALSRCPKLTALWSETTGVNTGEFSADGQRVLIAQDFGATEIYDLKTGKLLLHPFGPTRALMSASFSHDSRLVVTTSGDWSVTVWDANTLEQVSSWQQPTVVFNGRFSPDDRKLIVACKDKCARICDVRTGKTELAFPHRDVVIFAAFSPDGRNIVTCSRDHTARIWDATNGNSISPPLEHQGWVYSAAFSPDGKYLLTASGDHKARVWDVATGRKVSPNLIHGDAVTSAEFSPDGRLILTASLDGTVRLWSADDFEPYARVPILRQGDRVTHASFDASGQRILATCADGTVRIWDLAQTMPTPYSQGVFDHEGRKFLRVTNQSIEICDALTEKISATIKVSGSSVERAEFSGNGHFVVTSSISETNATATNRLISVWTDRGQAVAPGIEFTNSIAGFSVSDDGARLLTFRMNEAQLWDVQTRLPASPVLAHKDLVANSLFSPDGKKAVTISARQVYVWKAESGAPAYSSLSHAQQVKHAEFSLDSTRLVSCCSDPLYSSCYAQVWNAATGQPIGPKLKHPDGVLFASISPKGDRVATAGEDFCAIIWDAVTGTQLAVLHHAEKVQRTAFSQDGKWLVTASTDKTAQLWSVEIGDPLTPPLLHCAPLKNAQFLNDQDRFIVTDLRGSNYVWRVPVEQKPASDAVKIAHLLANDKTHLTGGRGQDVPLGGATLWQQMRGKYPSVFQTSTQEITAWDYYEADDSERDEQWFAAAFHLKRLLVARPNDQSLIKRLGCAQERLDKGF